MLLVDCCGLRFVVVRGVLFVVLLALGVDVVGVCVVLVLQFVVYAWCCRCRLLRWALLSVIGAVCGFGFNLSVVYSRVWLLFVVVVALC